MQRILNQDSLAISMNVDCAITKLNDELIHLTNGHGISLRAAA